MFLEVLPLLVEGMVSPLTTYRVYESYGFAFFPFLSFLLFPIHFILFKLFFATCLDSLNLNDIPLFLLTGVFLRLVFFCRA